MIKYNLNNIDDWYFNTSDIIKVYRNNAVCYYKITGGGDMPTAQTPCFAVVDDISQYSDTEFEDVFNNADGLWYKLNNLNQYEEYGIYGSGRTITTYEGKLTIDEEITPSPSRLPSGYTEVEYVESSGSQYINTGVYLNTSNFEIGYTVVGNAGCWGYCHQNVASGTWINVDYNYAYFGKWNSSNRVTVSSYTQSTETTIKYTQSGVTVNGTTISKNLQMGSDSINNIPLMLFAFYDFYKSGIDYNFNSKFKSFYVKNNGTLVRDFVPAKRDSDNKYGMYDLVNDTFYLSPNGNDFSGGSEVIPPSTTATCEFMYSGGSWINVGEVSGSTATLPNVPFTVNYNAKSYDSNTNTLFKTSGQLADVDAVITAGTPTVNDGYLTIPSGTRATISGYQTYFNRDNNNPNLTIISKQNTNGNNCHMFANRDSSYNWMYRCYSDQLAFHGSSSIGGTLVTTQPVIEGVRVDSNRTLTFNNYTDNTTTSSTNFKYGSSNNGKFALFQGYATSTGEYFVGDFYWVYMSQNTLTDEQVQQVIAYNEGSGGTPTYPIYYDVIQDPPNNVTFTSMTEAESYECPWVGMQATIDGDNYIFSGDSISGYEWVYKPSRLPIGYTEVEYIESNGTQYINTNAYITNTANFEVGYTISGKNHQWGYVHQNVVNGAWVSVEGIRAYFGRFNSSYWVDISNQITTSNNTIVYKSNSGITVNETFNAKTLSLTSTDNITTIPLHIFGWWDFYRGGVEMQQVTQRYKSFYLKVNGVLIRDLVPAKRDSDNKYGMYDLVSDTFYLSPNGNNFSGGNPV